MSQVLLNKSVLAPFDSDPCVYATNLAECIVKEGKAVGMKSTQVITD